MMFLGRIDRIKAVRNSKSYKKRGRPDTDEYLHYGD